MKKCFGCLQWPLLLFFFVTSCNGQNKIVQPKDSTGVSNPFPQPTVPEEKQPVNSGAKAPWLDPLFFIDGQLCAWVRKIFQDKRGNLWFGTNHYGVMRYNGDTLEYFSEKDGLGMGRITAIVEDKKGHVWFGTYGGLTKYNPLAHETGGKPFTNFTENDGLINNDVWSLIIDSKGIFWIGTAEGVSCFDGKEFTPFPLPQPAIQNKNFHISPNRVTCIAEDKNGDYWFGTDGYGICKYDPIANRKAGETIPAGLAGFTHFTKENGFSDNYIGEIMVDKNGNVWIGTMYGGVSKFDPVAHKTGGVPFTHFTQNGTIEGIEVGGFYEDKIGNVWFAAENFGVYRFDGKSFINLYKNEGLITNGILSIFEDKEGRFWFGGWGGLFRYDYVANGTDEKLFFPVTKEGPWAK